MFLNPSSSTGGALLGLYFDRVGQLHGSFRPAPNRYGLSVLGVLCEDRRFSPVQVPTIFNGDDGIRARDHSREAEGPVLIALVAAKEFTVRFRVFRHQNYHRTGDRLAGLFGDALNGYLAADQPERDVNRRTGRDVERTRRRPPPADSILTGYGFAGEPASTVYWPR